MLEFQISNVYQMKLDLGLSFLFPNIFSLWNTVTIMLALPVVNFVVLPCTPLSNMRERIGFGMTFILLSAVLMAYLEWGMLPLVPPGHQYLCLVLPAVCLSLGEIMLFVTGEV